MNLRGLDEGFYAFRRGVARVRAIDATIPAFATFTPGVIWMIGRAVPRLAPPANDNTCHA